MRYIVKSVVCDYGVFEKTDNGEQLEVICNSLSNAELIADILNTDLENTKYKVIKPSKIDKAIKEIKEVSFKHNFEQGEYIGEITEQWKVVKLDHVIEIIKRNIGESKEIK